MSAPENSKLMCEQIEFYKRLNESAQNHANDLKKLYNLMLEQQFEFTCLKLSAEALIENMKANQLVTDKDRKRFEMKSV